MSPKQHPYLGARAKEAFDRARYIEEFKQKRQLEAQKEARKAMAEEEEPQNKLQIQTSIEHVIADNGCDTFIYVSATIRDPSGWGSALKLPADKTRVTPHTVINEKFLEECVARAVHKVHQYLRIQDVLSTLPSTMQEHEIPEESYERVSLKLQKISEARSLRLQAMRY